MFNLGRAFRERKQTLLTRQVDELNQLEAEFKSRIAEIKAAGDVLLAQDQAVLDARRGELRDATSAVSAQLEALRAKAAPESLFVQAFSSGLVYGLDLHPVVLKDATARVARDAATETKRQLAENYAARERALLAANGQTITQATIQVMREKVLAQLRIAERAPDDHAMIAKWQGALGACDELLGAAHA